MKKDFKVGDVVICSCPYDPTKTVCKRVAAVAGDTVDPSVSDYPSIASQHVVVPPGHCWLLGDNAPNSLDSRRYGFVSTALIKGRVVRKFRLSPPFLSRIETAEENRLAHIDMAKDAQAVGPGSSGQAESKPQSAPMSVNLDELVAALGIDSGTSTHQHLASLS